MPNKYDAIVIGTGQSGPALAATKRRDLSQTNRLYKYTAALGPRHAFD